MVLLGPRKPPPAKVSSFCRADCIPPRDRAGGSFAFCAGMDGQIRWLRQRNASAAGRRNTVRIRQLQPHGPHARLERSAMHTVGSLRRTT